MKSVRCSWIVEHANSCCLRQVCVTVCVCMRVRYSVCVWVLVCQCVLVVSMINSWQAYNINNTDKALEHVDACITCCQRRTHTQRHAPTHTHTFVRTHLMEQGQSLPCLVFVYKLVINWLDGKCNLIKQTFQCGCPAQPEGEGRWWGWGRRLVVYTVAMLLPLLCPVLSL